VSFVLKTAWIAGIVFAVYYLMNMQKGPQAPPAANAQAPPAGLLPAAPAPSSPAPAVAEPNPNIELTTAASIQRQQLTAAKFRQRQLIATFAEVTRDLDDWEKELAAWEKTGPPLLKSDEGKKIAADPALVKRFRVVFNLDRPTRDALTAARKQAENLITPVREAERNAEDASSPAEELAKSLRELQTQARKARDSYRDARGAVDGLLAQATAPRGGGTAGDKTLEQATAAQVQEEALARAAAIETETKKARDEGTRLIAEEQAKVVRQDDEMKAARIRDQAEAKRQGLIRSGSIWKGAFTDSDVSCPTTFVIAKRDKDRIEGTMTWNYLGAKASVTIEGTAQGTAIRFKTVKAIAGNSVLGYTHDGVFDPIARTIGGVTLNREGRSIGRWSFKLSADDE
jgi:hypothetical protein